MHICDKYFKMNLWKNITYSWLVHREYSYILYKSYSRGIAFVYFCHYKIINVLK